MRTDPRWGAVRSSSPPKPIATLIARLFGKAAESLPHCLPLWTTFCQSLHRLNDSRVLWATQKPQRLVENATEIGVTEYGRGLLQRLHRVPTDTLIYDLQYRLRCRHCNRRDGFGIGILDTRRGATAAGRGRSGRSSPDRAESTAAVAGGSRCSPDRQAPIGGSPQAQRPSEGRSHDLR